MSEEPETVYDFIRAVFITFAVIYVPLRLLHFILLPTFISTNQVTGLAFIATAILISHSAIKCYKEEEKKQDE